LATQTTWSPLHTRGNNPTVAFQRGNLLAQDGNGRIVATRVDVPGIFIGESGAHVGNAREGKNGGLHQRRCHRTVVVLAHFAQVIEDVADIHVFSAPLGKV